MVQDKKYETPTSDKVAQDRGFIGEFMISFIYSDDKELSKSV